MIFYCQSQVEQNFLWEQKQKNFKLTDQYLKNSRQEFFLKKTFASTSLIFLDICDSVKLLFPYCISSS